MNDPGNGPAMIDTPVLASQRRERMCELIGRRGECTVTELAREFGVSGMTVRRDLDILRKDGKITRTHGGAVRSERIAFEFSFLYRMRENQQAKEAIAGAGVQLISDYQSVLLDSGTTTLALARRMREKSGLTVITTSLPIAAELQNDAHIRVLVLGGYVRPGSPDLFGAVTEVGLEVLHADCAFLGADAIDAAGAVYNRVPEVGRLLQKMAAAADRVFVVADHAKLGKCALARFGHLQEWAGLITDDGADGSFVAALRKAGARVIYASAGKQVGEEKRLQ